MRIDHRIIFETIENNSKVLDLGCGSGELLSKLKEEKNIEAYGIEIKEKLIYSCMEKGLTVFHGDIESGLLEYPDKSFDYIILNQSMQEIKNLEFLLKDALRVAKKIIIGFPNFAHIKSRIDLFFKGIAPTTPSLPYSWYNSPNVHFLSIKDFKNYCIQKNIEILKIYNLGRNRVVNIFPNIFALNSIFLLKEKDFNP
ncbi:MAG: methionine biosynthesis protein MetW [Candidatus Humimicrobiaceae bacterium]